MNLAIKGNIVGKQIKELAKSSSTLQINEIRMILALERAIARIEAYPQLSRHIIFKGGFVLLKTLNSSRYTRDIDALAYEIQKEDIPELVKEAVSQDLDDGIWYGDFRAEDILERGSYGGYRFTMAFQIGEPPSDFDRLKKLSRIHFDVGFGDAVDIPAAQMKMASVLPEHDPIYWKIYPLEFIYSEKLQVLVDRGIANSRAKDVYDMTILFASVKNKKSLIDAIERTFERRQTQIPPSLSSYAESLDTRNLAAAWNSIVFKSGGGRFNETWSIFVSQLRELDEIRHV